MSPVEVILQALDRRLDGPVEMTLFGRAALVLGFKQAPEAFALTRDVDAVLWLGQAEELLERTNFWEAMEKANQELRGQELYVSHLFTESQVVLTRAWRERRVALPGSWRHLRLWRLGDGDLLLSKLMRDDPIDLADATFIATAAGFSAGDIRGVLEAARIPDSPEVAEQFHAAAARLLAWAERECGDHDR